MPSYLQSCAATDLHLLSAGADRAQRGGGAMRIGSLFTGAGGLDMAVEAVFGGHTVWRSDIKPAAVQLIEHYWPGANLGDITTIDWSQVEPVDVICGGSPCQDMSAAGRRAGMTTGSRSGLWAHMRRAIEEIKPRYVVWENVQGAYSACAESESDDQLGSCPRCVDVGNKRLRHAPNVRAVGRVLGDLANLGFDAWWRGVRASDIGAPHERFRVFVVAAHPERVGRLGWAHQPVRETEGRAPAAGGGAEAGGRLTLLPTPEAKLASSGPDYARMARAGSGGHDLITAVSLLPTPMTSDDRHPSTADDRRKSPQLRAVGSLLPSPRQADGSKGAVNRSASIQDWRQYEPAIRRWELVTGRPAPPPTITGPKGGQRLSPDFVDWMMGWPAGWTDVPGLTRAQRLSLGGDGVVPQQAVAAVAEALTGEGR